MSNEALVLMISTGSVVTIVTLYFFIKILRTPPKEEDDSYPEE